MGCSLPTLAPSILASIFTYFFADNLEKLLMSSECLGLAHFREIVIQFLFLLWILVYFIFSWTAPNLFFLGFISVVSSVPSSLPLFKNLWILK